MGEAITGGCLCGNVAFSVKNIRPTPVFCHCTQCRKWSGHFWSATRADAAGLEFTGAGQVTWFRSSDHAERGFCATCGSSLFYRPIGASHVGIAAGALDTPTGMAEGRHIFVGSKGDYYTISDDLPQVLD